MRASGPSRGGPELACYLVDHVRILDRYLIRETLGPDAVAHYAAHARAEWAAFLAAVTDWEITRAFEAV